MSDWAETVLSWYEKRSAWIKWALFIFVFVVVGVLIFVSFFLSGKKLSLGVDDEDQMKFVKDNLEDIFKEELRTTQKMDSDIARKILEEEEKRTQIEKERKKGLEKTKEALEKIDSAIDFDSVDDAVNSYVKRARKDRKR